MGGGVVRPAGVWQKRSALLTRAFPVWIKEDQLFVHRVFVWLAREKRNKVVDIAASGYFQ